MILSALLILQGSLPCYCITVDPLELEMLYENFSEELSIPAEVTLDSITAPGTLAFRGGTSLFCEKKSWHVTLEDENAFPCGGHILLNAQCRDPSLMRNTLGMMITRRLGFPAPETEFVSLMINGNNMGVYERIERIDRGFYERNGLGFGPLFKNTDTIGRMVCQYSGRDGILGFEPKVDSQPYGGQLLEEIEACFRGDASSLATEEILAAFAVNTAIADQDGLIKNFYLHRYQDIWHFYPWDRDASFGNSWQGNYDSTWTGKAGIYEIGYFGGTRAILSDWESIWLFNDLFSSTREILAELPASVDSIRLLIRNDLASDPYYEYSIQQFDSLCSVLSSDIVSRAEYLEGASMNHPVPSIGNIEIPSCLNMQNSLEIEVELLDYPADGTAMVISFDHAEEGWYFMYGSEDGLEWENTIEIPPGTYSAHFSFGPWNSPFDLPVFYPSWGMREYDSRPTPSPSARVALGDLSPELLTPQIPLWCGENLWVLPVRNDASFPQDLSLCGFFIGDPPGSVFLAESILIQPEETFYLTNNAALASEIYRGTVFGDAGTPYPALSTLVLFDPSWHSLHSWHITDGDSLWVEERGIIPSEISMGNGTDWIELFNTGDGIEDLSGWYLRDSESNVCYLPEGSLVLPGSFALIAEDPQEFISVSCPVIPLEFRLDSDSDSILLYSNLGNIELTMGWNDSWAGSQTGIMYLASPLSAFSSQFSWVAAEPPGTPGLPNPGWESYGPVTRLSPAYPNPSNGRFSFFFETSSMPLEAILYDLCGRVISRLDLPASASGTVNADFSGALPSGVYVLYLRSQTGADSVRLTILEEE